MLLHARIPCLVVHLHAGIACLAFLACHWLFLIGAYPSVSVVNLVLIGRYLQFIPQWDLNPITSNTIWHRLSSVYRTYQLNYYIISLKYPVFDRHFNVIRGKVRQSFDIAGGLRAHSLLEQIITVSQVNVSNP